MFEVYLQRAEQLSAAKQLIQDDPPYASALALLSIHTAIALNDALLSKLSGATFKGEDHKTAVRETAKRCRQRGMDESGVMQLQKLIAAKSHVSYGDKSITFVYADALSQACIRFETWAYRRIKEIA